MRCQTPRVDYQDQDGNWTHVVFDYLVETTGGLFVAVSVKPERKRAEEEKKLRLIAGSRPKGINAVRLVTDREATLAAYYNANRILDSRELYEEEEAAILREEFKTLGSIVYFFQLYEDQSVTKERTNAIWHLIDTGELEPAEPGQQINEISRLKINQQLTSGSSFSLPAWI